MNENQLYWNPPNHGLLFLRNSIVYSPTTVHITDGYMLFFYDYKQISKLVFGIIQVCQTVDY
jgi:hypothetical protein